MIDITTQSGLFQLFATVLVPVVTGAIYCGLQYKAKALSSGEDFSTAKLYLTEGVAIAVGLYAFFIGGTPLSNADLFIQVGYYGGIIVAAESVLKIIFRMGTQSPSLVNTLGGVPAGKSDTVAAINTPAAAGGIPVSDSTAGPTPQVMKMPEANFKWMCDGHSQDDVLGMKQQVMAAEAAGLNHYYVSYKDRQGGIYMINNGEVYGSGNLVDCLKNAIVTEPPIAPAPGSGI